MPIPETMRVQLFDPQEIYDELLYLDFFHLPYPDLKETLYEIKECCLNRLVAQMPNKDGRADLNSESQRRNSERYLTMIHKLEGLLRGYRLTRGSIINYLKLDDLCLRVQLLDLDPSSQTRYYRRDLATRRTRTNPRR